MMKEHEKLVVEGHTLDETAQLLRDLAQGHQLVAEKTEEVGDSGSFSRGSAEGLRAAARIIEGGSVMALHRADLLGYGIEADERGAVIIDAEVVDDEPAPKAFTIGQHGADGWQCSCGAVWGGGRNHSIEPAVMHARGFHPTGVVHIHGYDGGSLTLTEPGRTRHLIIPVKDYSSLCSCGKTITTAAFEPHLFATRQHAREYHPGDTVRIVNAALLVDETIEPVIPNAQPVTSDEEPKTELKLTPAEFAGLKREVGRLRVSIITRTAGGTFASWYCHACGSEDENPVPVEVAVEGAREHMRNIHDAAGFAYNYVNEHGVQLTGTEIGALKQKRPAISPDEDTIDPRDVDARDSVGDTIAITWANGMGRTFKLCGIGTNSAGKTTLIIEPTE